MSKRKTKGRSTNRNDNHPQTPFLHPDQLQEKEPISSSSHIQRTKLDWLAAILAIVSLLISGWGLYYSHASVQSSQESAKIAKQAQLVGERPYITVQQMDLGEIVEGKIASAKIIFLNAGRTPALNTAIHMRLDFFPNDLPDDPDYGQVSDLTSKAFIAAGQTNPGIVFGERSLTRQEVEDVRSGKTKIYLFGFAKYADGFGLFHTTKFCGWYNIQKGSFTVCGKHESLD